MNIAICDDEAIAVSILKKRISSLFDQAGISFTLSTYTDGLALRNEILSGKTIFQALFLDIDMPNLNGIHLGEHLRKADYQGLIIFITNRADLVFDVFRVQPFRFIRKQKFNEEIGIVIHDVIAELNRSNADNILFHSGSELIGFHPLEIMYIESQRKNQYIHTANTVIEVSSSLKEISAQLEAYGFIQIHKSYYVNYRFIHSIDKTDIILDNQETLPISRQRLKEVKQQFQQLSLHY